MATPQYITSNPAQQGIDAGQDAQLKAALLTKQRADKDTQDANKRALASFYATPEATTPDQKALAYVAKTPGMGDQAVTMATAQSKATASKTDDAMNAALDGDVAKAHAIATQYNLPHVLQLLQQPELTQEVIAFGKTADAVRPKDNAYRAAFVQAGMAELPKIMGSVNPATGQNYTYQEALPLVQRAAMEAAKDVPQPEKGGFKIDRDAQGNILIATSSGLKQTGVKGGAKPGSKASAANSIQRTFTGSDGFLYATMRQPGPDGQPITKQLTDAQGQPIRSGDVTKLAGQIYLKSTDQLGGASVPDAQAAASDLYGQRQPEQPAPVQTRRFVPGKGFVAVP